MAIDKFLVEASHIMMFARSVGDANPIYHDEEYAKGTDLGGIIAPPTFAQSSAQFDPDYFLRPKIGGEGWFGSGKEPTGAKPSKESGGGGGGAAMGLHAEQHFEYHKPVKAGDVLTATSFWLVVSIIRSTTCSPSSSRISMIVAFPVRVSPGQT